MHLQVGDSVVFSHTFLFHHLLRRYCAVSSSPTPANGGTAVTFSPTPPVVADASKSISEDDRTLALYSVQFNMDCVERSKQYSVQDHLLNLCVDIR